MSKREETDLVEQLLNAADDIATISQTELAVLLRQAALDISALRDLMSVREQLTGGDRAA